MGNGAYWDQSLVFSGTSFNADFEVYTDSSSSTKQSSTIDVYTLDLGDAYTLADGKTAYKGVLTSVSSSETFYSSTYVSNANSSSYCGKTDWVINTTTDVSGLTCDGSEKDSVGDKWYIAYYIDGTILKIGSSEADNITSIGYTAYIKQ